MSKYDPNNMPTNLTEWNELIEYRTDEAKAKYDAAVAEAKAQAEAAYAKLPDDENKPTLADYVAQAVSLVEAAKDAAYWEQLYRSVGYYPQEQPEIPAPTFAELKAQKKAELDAAFYTACQKPFVVTAEGWRADANTDANRNVKGLIDALEMTGAEAASFMDYDNIERPVTLASLKALYLQIIQNGNRLYATKWQLRTAVEQAATEAELAAIRIEFA